jgi:hypothetical protein
MTYRWNIGQKWIECSLSFWNPYARIVGVILFLSLLPLPHETIVDATDAKGEPIHQTLMAKKMQRLDESPEFRPFKFRIQAFTNAFLEEVRRILEILLYLTSLEIFSLAGSARISGRKDTNEESTSPSLVIYPLFLSQKSDSQLSMEPNLYLTL